MEKKETKEKFFVLKNNSKITIKNLGVFGKDVSIKNGGLVKCVKCFNKKNDFDVLGYFVDCSFVNTKNYDNVLIKVNSKYLKNYNFEKFDFSFVKRFFCLQNELQTLYKDCIVVEDLNNNLPTLTCYFGHSKIIKYVLSVFNCESTRYPTYICNFNLFDRFLKLNDSSYETRLALLFNDCWAESNIKNDKLIVGLKTINEKCCYAMKPSEFVHHLYKGTMSELSLLIL